MPSAGLDCTFTAATEAHSRPISHYFPHFLLFANARTPLPPLVFLSFSFSSWMTEQQMITRETAV